MQDIKAKKFAESLVYIDTEFNKTTHEYVNPVCASILYQNKTYNFWVHNDEDARAELRSFIMSLKRESWAGYATTAEGRFFLALGIDPVKFEWVDKFLEYRMLTNQNDTLGYGEQLVDGKVKMTRRPPPKWERTEEDSQNSFKPTHSLAEATFKLTGEIRDTEHKNKLRDLIISDPEEFCDVDRRAILDYCEEDTKFLPRMMERILEEYGKLGYPFSPKLRQEMLLRGSYSALTAKMESRGYPINVEKTRNFSSSIDPILEQTQREINKLFPEISPFRYNPKERRFSLNQASVRSWLAANVDVNKWMKTDGWKKAQKEYRNNPMLDKPLPEDYLSLKQEAFEKVFPFRHSYPEDNFGAQMLRYLKIKQNMSGFGEREGKRSFWDSVGPDGRVRPYFNQYGSATGRSQPPSTSYLFLKPAWMRALCEPKPGRAVASYDYSSEEFLISALLSECENMWDAYIKGDVYLEFAKLVGAIPDNGTKSTHPAERQLFKAVLLGLSYLMSAKGLAEHLTNETGRSYSEEEAQEFIDDFYSEEAFKELGEFQQDTLDEYELEKRLFLKCGWAMWGSQDNFRSVTNWKVQGAGGSIMRKAVELCEEAGLEVIITLHDALYIEYDSFDFSALDKFEKCMRDAFVWYFDDHLKDIAKNIRLDGFTWSPDYPSAKVTRTSKPDGSIKIEREYESIVTPGGLEIECCNEYVDERAYEEYDKFSQYFERRPEQDL